MAQVIAGPYAQFLHNVLGLLESGGKEINTVVDGDYFKLFVMLASMLSRSSPL